MGLQISLKAPYLQSPNLKLRLMLEAEICQTSAAFNRFSRFRAKSISVSGEVQNAFSDNALETMGLHKLQSFTAQLEEEKHPHSASRQAISCFVPTHGERERAPGRLTKVGTSLGEVYQKRVPVVYGHFSSVHRVNMSLARTPGQLRANLEDPTTQKSPKIDIVSLKRVEPFLICSVQTFIDHSGFIQPLLSYKLDSPPYRRFVFGFGPFRCVADSWIPFQPQPCPWPHYLTEIKVTP